MKLPHLRTRIWFMPLLFVLSLLLFQGDCRNGGGEPITPQRAACEKYCCCTDGCTMQDCINLSCLPNQGQIDACVKCINDVLLRMPSKTECCEGDVEDTAFCIAVRLCDKQCLHE